MSHQHKAPANNLQNSFSSLASGTKEITEPEWNTVTELDPDQTAKAGVQCRIGINEKLPPRSAAIVNRIDGITENLLMSALRDDLKEAAQLKQDLQPLTDDIARRIKEAKQYKAVLPDYKEEAIKDALQQAPENTREKLQRYKRLTETLRPYRDFYDTCAPDL